MGPHHQLFPGQCQSLRCEPNWVCLLHCILPPTAFGKSPTLWPETGISILTDFKVEATATIMANWHLFLIIGEVRKHKPRDGR